MPTLVNLGGRLVPPEQALVPVLDRGFLYGDSVYEVKSAHLFGRQPFALGEHLEPPFEISAANIGARAPEPRETDRAARSRARFAGGRRRQSRFVRPDHGDAGRGKIRSRALGALDEPRLDHFGAPARSCRRPSCMSAACISQSSGSGETIRARSTRRAKTGKLI